MQIRIISFSDNYEGYKLKGYADIDNISELIKTLNYMKENDIPITINTEDIVDTDGEDYYIKVLVSYSLKLAVKLFLI